MKILFGITKSNFGGAQRYVYELAVEAKKRNHSVSVLCGQGEKLITKLGEEKIPTILLKDLDREISLVKEIKSFVEIIKVLKKEKPDVFHVNSSKMGTIGALAGRIVGIKKIIFTAHGWAFNEKRVLWKTLFVKFFAWLAVLLSHKTICVSDKTKRDVSSWPFLKNKLVVIYNGIPNFKLRERVNEALTVGTIAELHKIKGLDVLLNAWSRFIKNREAKLVIIGDGEEKENLGNMAKNLGISSSVIFKGYVDDARSFLPLFDIFCLPSRSEAMPYVLLEAGFAELPVVASAVGGIPEIIESGSNGILVPPENSEVLFSTLVLLANDVELRKRLGANLKASIEEKFSFEEMSKKTFALYL